VRPERQAAGLDVGGNCDLGGHGRSGSDDPVEALQLPPASTAGGAHRSAKAAARMRAGCSFHRASPFGLCSARIVGSRVPPDNLLWGRAEHSIGLPLGLSREEATDSFEVRSPTLSGDVRGGRYGDGSGLPRHWE